MSATGDGIGTTRKNGEKNGGKNGGKKMKKMVKNEKK